MRKNGIKPYQGVDGYLPGCFAHFRPRGDESLPGFLLRLAEANHYRDIQGLLTVVLPETHQALRSRIAAIRKSSEYLARLGRVACGDASALSHFQISTTPTNSLLIHDCRVPPHGFLPGGGSYCPQCLAENGYAREEWELAPVAVCSKHRCRLQDTCPHCGTTITWQRLRLCHCKACGGSLLQSAGNSSVTEQECHVSDDFSALADFRVEFSPGDVGVISWDEMLNVAQGLSQPPVAWLSQALSRGHQFMRLPVLVRRESLEIISETRDNRGTYRLHLLPPKTHEKLAVLGHFLPDDYIAETAFKFLMQCEQLSSKTARAISGVTHIRMPGDGAEQYGGRPPSISSEEDVMKLIGINWTAYKYLRRHNYIPFHAPDESLGIDIDTLLEAKHFMEHRLADLDILGRMVGMDVTWESLVRLPLPFHIPPLLEGKNRIAFDRLCDFQLIWLDKISSLAAPVSPVRLSEAIPSNSIPALSECLSAILNGRLTKCRWLPPYRWTDFSVEQSELAELGFPKI